VFRSLEVFASPLAFSATDLLVSAAGRANTIGVAVLADGEKLNDV
jgi:hypothetical protein